MQKNSHVIDNLFLCLAIATLVSALVLGLYLFSLYHKVETMTPSGVAGEVTYEDDGFPVVDWNYWQEVNPAVIGWITIPDTGIDFPIVQAPAEDPTYYLTHDVYGDWNYVGCVYLDTDNANGGLFGNPSATLFGHHLDDGTMFSEVSYYTDYDYATAHKRILIQSPTTKAVLDAKASEIMNGYDANKPMGMQTNKEAATWFTDEALPNCEVVLSDGTEDIMQHGMFTLCTCSYNYFANERTLVFCAEQ